MSVSKGIWSRLVSSLRLLLGLPGNARSEPAKAPVQAAQPLQAAQPAPVVQIAPAAQASPIAEEIDADVSQPERKARKFALAARLAVTSRLNRLKTERSRKRRSQTRKSQNRPVVAKAAAPKRSAKRPVWIGAEIRNRATAPRSSNVVPFRAKAGARPTPARPQIQASRRAA